MRPSRDTSSGLAFERYASIEATIKDLGFIINTRPHSKFKAIQRGKHFLGYLLPKHKLYQFVPHYRAFISRKLLPNYEVHYIYILNDWFKKPMYKDVREYIKSIDNCDYLWYNDIKDYLGGIL